jgi:hypothetical protein
MHDAFNAGHDVEAKASSSDSTTMMLNRGRTSGRCLVPLSTFASTVALITGDSNQVLLAVVRGCGSSRGGGGQS